MTLLEEMILTLINHDKKTMKSYKVEFHHVFDVMAKDEAEAVKLADEKQDEAIASRTMHYYQDSDPAVYDVTGTDDALNV